MLTLAVALVFAGCLACASSHGDKSKPISQVRTIEVDGLEIRLEARGKSKSSLKWALDRSEAEARRLAALLLAAHPGSEIDVLNHVPTGVEVELSPDTLKALKLALEIAEATDGAYDPTARMPLRKLWGFDEDSPHVPREFEIASVLRNVDWTNIEIADSGKDVSRSSKRTRVDLGPVAVGSILDGAAATMGDSGAFGGFASSSEIWVAVGAIDQPWSVGTGAGGAGPHISVFAGATAVALPGPIRRTADGRVLREPFDPRTGKPADHAVWAMARAGTGARAGGFASALLVMGQKAPSWLSFAEGVEGAILQADGKRYTSPGVRVRWDDGAR